MNEARAAESARPGARERPGPLTDSAVLSNIAAENSRWMMANNKRAADKAQALLAQQKVRLKSVQMALFTSADPIKAEEFAEALKARYQEIGVGVVQSAAPSGEKLLWTTVLLGER